MKKLLVIGVVLLATLASVIVIGLLIIRSTRLTDYIGSQVVRIVNRQLVPQMAFESVEYTPPGEVLIHGPTLTAPDGTVVFEATTLRLRLDELPRIDAPLKIAEIELQSPRVNVFRDEDGSIRGLIPFVRETPKSDPGEGPSTNLSDVLRLERVTIIDGGATLNLSPDDPTMEIEGLSTSLDIQHDEQGPGWYAIELDADRKPMALLHAAGAVNLDTLTVRLDEARFQLDVHEDSISWLPAALQKLATEHEVEGDLQVQASGTIPVMDLQQGDATASVSLDEATFAFGEYRIPVQSLSLDALLREGLVRVPTLAIQTLQGTIEASASLNLASESRSGSAKWTVVDVNLNEAMRTKGDESEIAGIVSTEGSALFDLADFKGSVTGTGGARIREGRLVFIPGLRDLIALVKPDAKGLTGRNHRLDAQFSFEEQGIRVDNSELVTGVIAARASGLISWDQELDLSVNAGPLEKLQSMLGEVGNLLGKVTDQLVKYRVRGPIAEPKVSVAPLGVGG